MWRKLHGVLGPREWRGPRRSARNAACRGGKDRNRNGNRDRLPFDSGGVAGTEARIGLLAGSYSCVSVRLLAETLAESGRVSVHYLSLVYAPPEFGAMLLVRHGPAGNLLAAQLWTFPANFRLLLAGDT
jgi:hypothetical protein